MKKLWKTFFPDQQADSNMTSIHKELVGLLPNMSEEELLPIACLSGLMARVAYADMNIDDNEIQVMQSILQEYGFNESTAKAIAHVSKLKIEEFVDQEDHLYLRPLNELMDKHERCNILKILFQIAAADNSVEAMESESIKLIAKGLHLSHNDYVAAKMTVRDKIAALR